MNLLRLRYSLFPGKFMNFLEAATRGVLLKKMKKAVLKNLAIFTGMLQACNLFKNRLEHIF